MLIDTQFQHFRTFEFVIMRDLFQPGEVEILCSEFELPAGSAA